MQTSNPSHISEIQQAWFVVVPDPYLNTSFLKDKKQQIQI